MPGAEARNLGSEGAVHVSVAGTVGGGWDTWDGAGPGEGTWDGAGTP